MANFLSRNVAEGEREGCTYTQVEIYIVVGKMVRAYVVHYILDQDGKTNVNVIQEFDYDGLEADKKVKSEIKKLYAKYVKYKKIYIFGKLAKEVSRLNLHMIHIKEKVEVWNNFLKIKLKVGDFDRVTSHICATIRGEKDYKEMLNKVKRDLVFIDSETGHCPSVCGPEEDGFYYPW